KNPDYINVDITNQNPFTSQFILGNLTNPQDLAHLPKVDTVIHIAGIHPIMAAMQNESLMWQVNVVGDKNVFKILQRKKFIYISSSAAAKDSSYGKSKLAAELIVEQYSHQFPVSTYALRTKGFTPFNSPSYKSFLDYANWNLTGAVH